MTSPPPKESLDKGVIRQRDPFGQPEFHLRTNVHTTKKFLNDNYYSSMNDERNAMSPPNESLDKASNRPTMLNPEMLKPVTEIIIILPLQKPPLANIIL